MVMLKWLELDLIKKCEYELGTHVVYVPSYVRDLNGQSVEHGIVNSWNDSFIFVKYGDRTQSQATKPEDLMSYTAFEAKRLLLK